MVTIENRYRVHSPLSCFRSEADALRAGHWFAATLFGRESSQRELARFGIRPQATMTTSAGTSGGYAVPFELDSTIVELMEQRGVFARYARPVLMASDLVHVALGGSDPEAFWTSEGDSINEDTAATLEGIELRAKKLAAYLRVSAELDEDALIDFSECLVRRMAYAMADKIDRAGFLGDGTSAYGGALGVANAIHSNAVQNAASGNTTVGSLDATDFENTIGIAGPFADQCWYAHPSVAAKAISLRGCVVLQRDPLGVMRPSFGGFPIIPVACLPSAATAAAGQVVALFGSLQDAALFGVRRSVRTEVSRARYFESDQLALKVTQRCTTVAFATGEPADRRPLVALRLAGV